MCYTWTLKRFDLIMTSIIFNYSLSAELWLITWPHLKKSGKLGKHKDIWVISECQSYLIYLLVSICLYSWGSALSELSSRTCSCIMMSSCVCILMIPNLIQLNVYVF